ncbi:MAG: SRPBCC domain-containing protein [Bacteroidia bacterium]
MSSLIVKNSIVIHANTSKVWNALVNPEQTKKYMFGCGALSDWKKESALLWKGVYENKEIIFVKGFILDIQREKLLTYSTIDPNAPIEDIPENYLTVTYHLVQESDTKTTLTVTQGDYSKVTDGEKRYKEAFNNGEGWNPILMEIKKLVKLNLKK